MTSKPRFEARVFGRRRTRRLSPAQEKRWREILPRYEVKEKELKNWAAGLDFTPTSLGLEIGFGAGEHLLAQAAANPRRAYLGMDVFENGIVSLLAGLERAQLNNVRLFVGDARAGVAALARASLAQVFILYPDPWPKPRHHKRRLLGGGFWELLYQRLAQDARLFLASDDASYSGAMLLGAQAHGGFAWRAARANDWRTPPPAWHGTRYEAKALLAGRVPTYLDFTRRAPVTPGYL